MIMKEVSVTRNFCSLPASSVNPPRTHARWAAKGLTNASAARTANQTPAAKGHLMTKRDTDEVRPVKACKNCLYWMRNETDYRSYLAGIRRCSRIPHGADITEWSDELDNVLKPEYEGIKAVVDDGSGYRAELSTMPDFYCSEFKFVTITPEQEGE